MSRAVANGEVCWLQVNPLRLMDEIECFDMSEDEAIVAAGFVYDRVADPPHILIAIFCVPGGGTASFFA